MVFLDQPAESAARLVGFVSGAGTEAGQYSLVVESVIAACFGRNFGFCEGQVCA